MRTEGNNFFPSEVWSGVQSAERRSEGEKKRLSHDIPTWLLIFDIFVTELLFFLEISQQRQTLAQIFFKF